MFLLFQFLSLLKSAGVHELVLPIESGSARVLKSTKNITRDFEPEMYIVRPYPNDRGSRKKGATAKTIEEGNLDKDLDTMKKKSKDDW